MSFLWVLFDILLFPAIFFGLLVGVGVYYRWKDRPQVDATVDPTVDPTEEENPSDAISFLRTHSRQLLIVGIVAYILVLVVLIYWDGTRGRSGCERTGPNYAANGWSGCGSAASVQTWGAAQSPRYSHKPWYRKWGHVTASTRT
jgi:hypothetical protein